jgi:hypothetical protein
VEAQGEVVRRTLLPRTPRVNKGNEKGRGPLGTPVTPLAQSIATAAEVCTSSPGDFSCSTSNGLAAAHASLRVPVTCQQTFIASSPPAILMPDDIDLSDYYCSQYLQADPIIAQLTQANAALTERLLARV